MVGVIEFPVLKDTAHELSLVIKNSAYYAMPATKAKVSMHSLTSAFVIGEAIVLDTCIHII